MKTLICIVTLAFCSQVFAAPVCLLEITKDTISQKIKITLEEIQNPHADIPGYYFNDENPLYTLSIFNADGNYSASLIAGPKAASADISDEDLVLELNSKGSNFLLNCPKYIY